MSDEIEITSYPGLDPRVMILRAGEEVDAVFVRTERFCVLVDTLSTPRLCAQALAKLGVDFSDPPLLVVNSHMDWDHFWGNAAIAGRAPILAHAAAAMRFRDQATAAKLTVMQARNARFADVTLAGPTVTFTESLVLDGGDLTLELIHTPGHTPDHLAIWIPEIATCLAVDAVEEPMPRVWSDDPADLLAMRASLLRLRDLGARFVIPARGWTHSPDMILRNLAYFDALAARVGQLDRDELRNGDPALRPGLAFEEFVPGLARLSATAAAFYRGFHAHNLRATICARLAQDRA